MKKALSLILSIYCLITCLSMTALAAAGSASYTVSSGVAKPGDTVDITVTMSSNIPDGYSIGGFDLNYDTSVLTLKSATIASQIRCASYQGNSNTKPYVYFCNEDFSAVTSDSETITLSFAVSEEAEAGTYTIVLSKLSENAIGLGAGDSWFMELDANYSCTALDVDPNVSNGSITVSTQDDCSAGNATAGDVTYAWGYGGTITEDGGEFIIKPYTADGIHYVIDTVVVDGEARSVSNQAQPMTVSASSSVFATFAYTCDF